MSAAHAGQGAARARRAARSSRSAPSTVDAGRRARGRRDQPRPRGRDRAPAASARTSSTASTSSRSARRRCASASRTCRSLVEHFARRFCRREQLPRARRFAAEALDALAGAALARATCASCKNLVERLLILSPGDAIAPRGRAARRPAAPSPSSSAALLAVETLREFRDLAEKLFLLAEARRERLERHRRRRSAIDTPRSNLYKKMEQYEIHRDEHGGGQVASPVEERGNEPDGDDRLLTPCSRTSGALRRGHFLLSSGLHSPAYVQCALLLELPVAGAAGRGAGSPSCWRDRSRDSVLSPALGGVIIGHEVAAALGVPFRFVERDRRRHGAAPRLRPRAGRAGGDRRGRGDDRQVDARDRRGRRDRWAPRSSRSARSSTAAAARPTSGCRCEPWGGSTCRRGRRTPVRSAPLAARRKSRARARSRRRRRSSVGMAGPRRAGSRASVSPGARG